MKRIMLLVFACLIACSVSALANVKEKLQASGYKVYEADDLLVLMSEVSPDTAMKDVSFPEIDGGAELSAEEKAYLDSFSRILLFAMKNDTVYIGAEMKTPVDSGVNMGLISSDALKEMFGGMTGQ